MRSVLPRLLLASLLLVTAASARVTEKFSQTYPLTADGSLSLSNLNGDVSIETWDRDEVAIEAEKIASNDGNLARIRIAVDHSPGRIAIKTEVERKKFFFWVIGRAEVRYRLKVPARATLRKIDVVNSDVRITGLRGYADVESVNGSIEADGLSGGGRFETVNGSINARFSTVSPGDRISLATINGSCTAVLPADAAFALKAGSLNGRVHCDFPISIGKTGRSHLAGSVNGGGATLMLDSVNGSLSVRKSD